MKDSGIQGCSEPGPRAQSKRKRSLFNLTLFSYDISSLLLFLVSVFHHQGELFFFFMCACTAALEQEILVGDGWMDGSSEEEEEEGKRMGRELSAYVVCVSVCVSWNGGDAGMESERGCAAFLIAINASMPPIPCLNTVISICFQS